MEQVVYGFSWGFGSLFSPKAEEEECKHSYVYGQSIALEYCSKCGRDRFEKPLPPKEKIEEIGDISPDYKNHRELWLTVVWLKNKVNELVTAVNELRHCNLREGGNYV